jgi:hypothetical protein
MGRRMEKNGEEWRRMEKNGRRMGEEWGGVRRRMGRRPKRRMGRREEWGGVRFKGKLCGIILFTSDVTVLLIYYKQHSDPKSLVK